MVDAAGKVIAHDVVLQTHQVMTNVRAILEDAGSSWEKIVGVTVFLTDMERDFAASSRVDAEYFTTHQLTKKRSSAPSSPSCPSATKPTPSNSQTTKRFGSSPSRKMGV